MLTGKKFGTLTLPHNGRDHRCEWTLLNDRSLLVMVWITDTHIARQWTFPLAPDVNLTETARNVGIGMLGPES